LNVVNPQKELRLYIKEYFEIYDTAHMTDLFNYILIEKNDFTDFSIFEEELLKLTSEGFIKIENDKIYRIVNKLEADYLFDYEFGEYNFVISVEILNIDKEALRFDQIINRLNTIRKDFKKYDFLPNYAIEKTEKKELLIEFIADDWEGTIIIKRKSFEICTFLKRNEFLINWEKYIEFNFTPNDEIYRSLPASSHALFLYKLIKSILNEVTPECKLNIICAEFRKSQ